MSAYNFFEETNPYKLFDHWYAEAVETEINDPNAMAVASVDDNGMPNVRTVLMKEHDERGFVFYTNLESDKGREILSSGKASFVMHWKSRQRQVRVRGYTEVIEDSQADAYFNSRHRNSRIGAWASQQSRPLASRAVFEEEIAKYEAQFEGQEFFPRPPHWSGIRIKPMHIEFWQDQEHRLHDRLIFTLNEADEWQTMRYYP